MNNFKRKLNPQNINYQEEYFNQKVQVSVWVAILPHYLLPFIVMASFTYLYYPKVNLYRNKFLTEVTDHRELNAQRN